MINNPKIVRYFPVAATVLMETASVAQLWRMWTTHTAAGQSLIAWSSVLVALALWFNWYRVITPNEKVAKWTTVTSIVLVTLVLGSVIWWRAHGQS